MAGGDSEWLRVYARVVAMLPRVEALAAAGRARLEAINELQHKFWEARHALLQAEESWRRSEAAYIDLQPTGDDRKLAELQESDFEDLKIVIDVLAAENTELQIKVKEVDAGAEHSQITRDLEAGLRELKQAYEALCSEKDKEVSQITTGRDFVQDQFKTLERDYADLLSCMKKEATRATQAAQELQQNIEQLQVVSQKKDDEIRMLRAQPKAKAAETKRKFVREDKLLEVHCMPEKIDGETEKHKDKQSETDQIPKKDMSETQKKYCSEAPALRGETKNCPSKQMLADGQPDTNQKRKFAAFLSDAWSPQDAKDVTRTPLHVSRTIESSLQQFPVYGTQPLEFLEKIPNTIDELRAPNVMNRSAPSSDLGSSLVPGFHAKKNSVKHHRNVKPPGPIDNEHTLGVEGRLNSLLNQDGGISSRKDSTNEYLKLLVMTAADGDAGGSSKSIRDLALILEALIQTRSGAILLDIINMNGLQILHNILKQNKDHFIRRPVIRKLLKVLEFLALRGILTAEKINESPGCAGMESFRDSMLKLTRHSDKHVHSIARKFCDKWILPYMDGPANCSRRKRRSHWDRQPESHYKMVGLQIAQPYSGHGESYLETSLMRNKSHGGNWATSSNHNDVSIVGSSTTDGTNDDVPPGFEPRQQERQQPAQACLETGGVAPGFCQGRIDDDAFVSAVKACSTGTPNSSVGSRVDLLVLQHKHYGVPTPSVRAYLISRVKP